MADTGSLDMTTAKRTAYLSAFLFVIGAGVLVADIVMFNTEPALPECPDSGGRIVPLNNTACLKARLSQAHAVRGYTIGFELVDALASFLVIPSLLALGDVVAKKSSLRHLMIPPLVAVPVIRFFELSVSAGVTQVTTWIGTSSYWNLDGPAVEALVISTWVSRSAFVWLSATDSLLLGIGMLSAAKITYDEGKLSRKWGHLSLFAGILAVLIFLLDIARFASWGLMMMASGLLQFLLNLILLPVWLLWLGNQLGSFTGRTERLATGRGDDGL